MYIYKSISIYVCLYVCVYVYVLENCLFNNSMQMHIQYLHARKEKGVIYRNEIKVRKKIISDKFHS